MGYDAYISDYETDNHISVDSVEYSRGEFYREYDYGHIFRMANLSINIFCIDRLFRLMGDDGVFIICDKTGKESVPILESALKKLTDNEVEKHREDENVKEILLSLIAFSKLCHRGAWTFI